MPHFYFDHNATTPVDAAALDAFVQTSTESYGNASSIHYFGQRAKQKLESARRAVAAMLHTRAPQIVFTSGGTESNNLAIFGAIRGGRHVVTTTIEHPSVLNACAALDADVTYVPVGSSGVVDPDDIRRALHPDTALVSVIHANNETGAIQPIADIAAFTRGDVALHVDGVQAPARVDVDVEELGVDFYSISGHKLNAVKGTGALYCRKDAPLRAIQFGGFHERGRRAGTENVAGAASMGVACALPRIDVAALRDRLEQGILDRVPTARVNGCTHNRLNNTTNICFGDIDGQGLVIALDLRGFAVSSGSACSSGSMEPSHVLLAMGLSDIKARASVRFSLGIGNTVEQVDALIDAVGECV